MKPLRALPVLLALPACAPPASRPATPPPKPAAVVAREADLITVTLAPEAEARLAVRTEPLALQPVARTRQLAGEATIPAGRSVVLTAPVAGTLDQDPPAPGTQVSAGATLATLAPLFSVEATATLAAQRADAAGAVAAARVQVEAGAVALARAERLLQEQAGSQRAVDEARAARDAARAALAAAEARGAALAQAATPQLIVAPFAGTVLRVLAAGRQAVTAGAPLCEVAALDLLWVRVPVFSGELADVDTTAPLQCAGRTAPPVPAPPSADPRAATVDLVYVLDNRDQAMRPGQRLDVSVPLRASGPALVLAWSAVVHDAQGGTWVYECTAAHTFVRRRVAVRSVTGAQAVLADGPAPGTAIVVQGAAELLAIEFGHGR